MRPTALLKTELLKRLLMTIVLCLLLAGGIHNAYAATPTLTMTHVPVFRRELMQSQLTSAYEDVSRQWGAPIQQLVFNSYCDAWQALHAKTYPIQAIPSHWLPAARQLGYTVLIGVTHDDSRALLLTRTVTDEQLKNLLQQQSIATPDRLALVTSVGRRYLETQLGLSADQIKLATMPYDDMPLLSLVQGKYQAALTSPIVYSRMQSALKQDIRVISVSSSPARAAFVVDPAQLTKTDAERLGRLLLTVNRKSQPHEYHYVTADELAKSAFDEPTVDASQCPSKHEADSMKPQ